MSKSPKSCTLGKLPIAMLVIAAILTSPTFVADFGPKAKIPDLTSDKPISGETKTSTTTIAQARIRITLLSGKKVRTSMMFRKGRRHPLHGQTLRPHKRQLGRRRVPGFRG